jgi:adenosylcobinamide kinase/adenosylcobinamide-phosphate guanylyltransferase
MKHEIIYITGGAACGKSTYASDIAERLGGAAVTFIATAIKSDDEMRKKISLHKKIRPAAWKTIEVGDGLLTESIKKITTPVAVVDCMTMFASTRMVIHKETQKKIVAHTVRAVRVMQKHPVCKIFIIVSNEVGWGLVPEHPIGRVFRETLGTVNKKIMASCDKAFLLVSGHPLQLK